MKTYKGTVSNVSARPWTDRETGRSITLYSFQLEGGNKWYRTGETQPPFDTGDNIQFVEHNNKVDTSSIEKIAASEVQQAPSPAPAGKSWNKGGAQKGGQLARDDYWTNKEKRDIEREEFDKNVRTPMIEYQSARKSATDLVVAALQADALSFGSAAKGKKLEMLVEFVEEVTRDMVARANTFREELSGDE